MTRAFGEQKIPMYAAQMSKMQSKDDGSQFSYAGKSKLLYNRKPGSQRSRTSSKYGGLHRFNESDPYDNNADSKSRLSKAGLQRFNEELLTKSKAGSQYRGPRSINKSSLVGSNKVASQLLSKPSIKRSVFDKPAEKDRVS